MKKICICLLLIFSLCFSLMDFSIAQAYPGYREITGTWTSGSYPNTTTHHEYTEWCCQYKCVVLRKWTD